MFDMSWKVGRRLIGWLFVWLGLLLPAAVQAADHSAGVDFSAGTATLWFRSNVSTSWVDAHYTVNNGAQQNVRMAYNSAAGRFETRFAASAGQTVRHWYTHFSNGAASDTPITTSTIGSDGGGGGGGGDTGGGGGGGGGGGTAFTQGAADATGGALIWFSAANLQWVDIHYDAGAGQQNVRMTPNTGAGRHEIKVNASAGAVVRYSFTYFLSGVGAADTGLYSYTVGGGGSQERVATPTFTPPAGSYGSAQSVAIASATAGAEIRYTLDGSTPAAGSALYTGPVAVASTLTLKAIARKSGMLDSAVGSASYTISGGPQTGYSQGVSELGASATVWFKPVAAMNFVILHYKVGNEGSEINPHMVLNTSLGRYEFTISPVSPGKVLYYWFTYAPVSGAQTDSPRYTHTLGADNGIAKPTFSPGGGSYATAQQVTLATTQSGGVVRYTTDGTAPTQQSPQYSGPITVSRATTIYAATFTSNGQSAVASATYVIGATGGQVQAPVFSHPSGSYGTRLRVNLLSETTGASIRYTTDGSTPTLDSPAYGAPIEVFANTTIRAAAFKSGMTPSAVTSATYTITGTGSSAWNGLTTFNIVNATRGRWPDSQVYWAIIGKDWTSGQFVWVNAQGQLVPMSLGDNGALTKNGVGYTNYFHRLDQKRSITIPPINSARLLMSVGSPMYIQVNRDVNGNIGYAGANIENPTDPNIDVYFDFGEFAILPPGRSPQGIFINTTRVDQFGFPLKLEVTGLDGFKQTVGETLGETRDELFAKFIAEVPAEFRGLAQPPYSPYRIMAPAHASFQGDGPNAHYLDAYISSVWQQYANQDLVIDLRNGWAPFTGRVVNGKFRFTDGTGTYWVNGKPTTAMAMLGNGLLDDKTGASDIYKQLQLQAQLCAALNRRVAHQPFAQWWNGNAFYPAGQPANAFAKFWHDHSYNALAYGFAYDDVGGFSPSIHTEVPVSVTYTIGW
ncbi:MAG: beta-1,3-glucanase family protein [Pseudomonadota bacterium]